jgi:DNA-binding response OmpR family regulator
MSDKIHVLITDDEPLNLELMEEVLEDYYQVTCVSSGQECLTYLESNTPDILLLDVAMPGIDGYEVCKRIKADEELTLPILFVSARGSLEERLAGYEAGGDDYLVKPFNNQELIAKVNNMVIYLDKQNQISSQYKQATDMAMMLMTNSGESGVVVNFIRQTFACEDFIELTKAIFESLEQFELNSTIQYYNGDKKLETFDSSGLFKPVEAELLELTRGKGRIFNFNSRSIFNFSHCSILIKNMPAEEDKYGRFLDHLCLLMEGANARVIAVIKEIKIKEHVKYNNQLMINTKQGMVEIKQSIEQQKEQAISISAQLMEQLDKDLLLLGLDEDQEKYLVALIEGKMSELSELFDKQEAVEGYFNTMINSLK